MTTLKPEKINNWWVHFEKTGEGHRVTAWTGTNKYEMDDADFAGLYKNKSKAVEYLKNNLARRID